MPKICLLVSNDLTRDPRVTKQAVTAAKSGYDTLVACWANGDNHPPLVEKKDGYKINRGLFNPYWNPKILLINFRLTRFNLLLAKRFLFGRLKSFFKPIRSVLRFVSKTLRKIYRIFFGKSLSQKKAATVQATQVEQAEAPQVEKKKNLLIRIISILNIYRYYYHYYKTMYQHMINEGVKFKPEIVHANDLDTLLPGYIFKKKTGARLIYDAHEIWTEQGLAYPKIINLAFKYLESFLFRKIDHFITVNQSLADVLDEHYHLPKTLKQTIIFNCPRYQKCDYKAHNPKKVVALYQGRYSPNRGLEQIVEAGKYLNPGIEIHFRGLGDEELLKELKRIAKESGRENVKFHPPVEMKDLVESASTADIGLIAYLPVHIDNELCMPNKVFEYMMAGLALATSDLPELRRLIGQYSNGATFDPYSPKDIAKKINKIAGKDLQNYRKRSLEAAKNLQLGRRRKEIKSNL